MPKKSVQANSKNHLFYFLTALGVILILILAGANIANFNDQRQTKVLGIQDNFESEKIKELIFWEEFLSKNPDYRDGWIEIARLSYELGDKDYSVGALKTAKGIDPNSEKILTLEGQMNIR